MTEFCGTQIHLPLINVRPITVAVAVSSERHDNFHESFSYVYNNNSTVFRPCYVIRHPPTTKLGLSSIFYCYSRMIYARVFFLQLSASFSRQRFPFYLLVSSDQKCTMFEYRRWHPPPATILVHVKLHRSSVHSTRKYCVNFFLYFFIVPRAKIIRQKPYGPPPGWSKTMYI